MRDLIINLIEKVIIPKYGELSYHVIGTNHFPRRSYPGGFGYIVEFENVSPLIQKELVKSVKMILEMLGLKHVTYHFDPDYRNVLEIFGIQEES